MTTEELDYLNQPRTALEIIKFARNKELIFIHYFEAIIDRKGKIHFAIPCHSSKIMQLANQQYGFTLEDLPDGYNPVDYLVSRYGYISVWYNCIVQAGMPPFANLECLSEIEKYIPKITKAQTRTVQILIKSGLIKLDPNITYANEYQQEMYIKNRANFKK